MLASGNAEALVTDAMRRSVGLALDAALFDAVAGDDTRPAGLRHGHCRVVCFHQRQSRRAHPMRLMGGASNGHAHNARPMVIAMPRGRASSSRHVRFASNRYRDEIEPIAKSYCGDFDGDTGVDLQRQSTPKDQTSEWLTSPDRNVGSLTFTPAGQPEPGRGYGGDNFRDQWRHRHGYHTLQHLKIPESSHHR